ncbi:MAG: HlyD family secretion protein [Bacteroidota bacterium]
MKSIKIIIISVLLAAFAASCDESDKKSDAYGNFEAVEVIVAAQSQGELEEFNLSQGQELSAGQVVGYTDTTALHLNRREIKAQKQAVKTRLSNLNAEMAVQQQQLENLEITLNRVKKLMQDKAATQQKLDDIEGKVKLAKKQMKATKVQKQGVYAEMEVLDVKLMQLSDKIENALIKNPVKGTVINKFAEQGELVTAGKSLYKIARLNDMELKVYVSGAQLPHVKVGQEVEVLIDEDRESNRKLKGTVSWIADDAEFTPKVIQTKKERVKLVYAVKVKVPNDGSLKIGMPGEVNF